MIKVSVKVEVRHRIRVVVVFFSLCAPTSIEDFQYHVSYTQRTQ